MAVATSSRDRSPPSFLRLAADPLRWRLLSELGRSDRRVRGRGIDLGGRRSKHLGEFAEEQFDYVISLCDRVREVCPEFPGHPNRIHWSIPDPAREGQSDAETYLAFERTADELATRIPFLLELIAHTTST